MKPCSCKMHFGFGEKYPKNLQHLTKDGRHHGEDRLCVKGSKILACVNGAISDMGYKRGYGLCIYIEFFYLGGLYRLILAHLSKLTPGLKVGDKIAKTAIVGLSGDTGSAKGHPHLHLEVQKFTDKGWIPVNPSFV